MAGGRGGSNSTFGLGGSGGTGTDGEGGGDGIALTSFDPNAAVGGGGGGAGGGAGGNGSGGAVGGAGGTAANRNGGDGEESDNSGGGGGGGGFHGYVGDPGGLTDPNTVTVGGNGGKGGGGFAGGGGGAGGYGAIVSGTNFTVERSITGGNGGFAGDGVLAGSGGDGGIGLALTDNGFVTNQGEILGGNGGDGGFGGAGGVGLAFTGTGSGAILVNIGNVKGGDAGNVGSAGPGEIIPGGAGVSGAGMSIVTDGSIAGGVGSTGDRAFAINFTGGANKLAIGANATFNGAVNVQADTLTLDQDFGAPVGFSADATLSAPITGAGAVVKAGAGTVTLFGDSSYSGGTTITNGTLATGGILSLGSGAVSFQAGTGNTATLALESGVLPASGGTFGNTLDSFGDGESLVLKGFAFNSLSTTVTYDPTGRILSVSNGSVTQNFNMSNADPEDSGAYYAHDDGNGGTRIDNVVCFASGTMIRTLRGDVPVETLTIGDLVVTASGAARPIRWIGTRSFDCSAHPEPAMVRPVRIAAGAFGAGRPYRDLTLSPHHAVAVTCLDEVLIPIRLLVNGASIAQIDDASAVTYWHIELASHDILLANGLPAESYIDVGNRCDFEGEASLYLHPRFETDPLAAYCRPLVTGGGVLAAVRAQLAALVAEDAVASTAPFHLLVDGTPIAPVVKGDAAAFAIPAGAQDIRLVSPAWSPREADPASTDDRSLGLMIEALTLEDLFGRATPIPLDHPGLRAGFHPVERNATGRWRWTDGDALIDLSRLDGTAGPFVMRLSGRFAAPARMAAAPVAAAA